MNTDTFDDMSALIREAESERERFLERFAALCEESLPRQTTVIRQKQGWFGKTSLITALEVRLADHVYRLERGDGSVAASAMHEVRGIVLSRHPLPVRGWIEAVMTEIGRLHHSTAGEGEAVLRATGWGQGRGA